MHRDDSPLSETSVSPDPFAQFDIWYREHSEICAYLPETVFLATSSPDGKVSSRTVLLREYNQGGFTFYTNYGSRKGMQLLDNHHAALLFYWPEKRRQIRIEGIAGKTPADISDQYFASRPRENQIAAWASIQSSEIPDRIFLEKQFDLYTEKFRGREVPRPANWGGFIIRPVWFEFWQDREFRLHDRITYSLTDFKWEIGRLSP